MEACFEIEWPDDYGPAWMNKDNLLICLRAYCPNTEFSVSALPDLDAARKEIAEAVRLMEKALNEVENCCQCISMGEGDAEYRAFIERNRQAAEHKEKP